MLARSKDDPTSMRIKRLDGVRAIAVVLMILFQHSFLDLGWTGGELFFVLSGFLLTRILRASRTDKSYWSRFYLTRVTRIVPLMVLILIVNEVATRHLPLIGLAGYALFLGDVVGVLGYTGGSLGALWGIAVGAHFVVLWSIAVRFVSRRSLLTIAVCLLIIEPILRTLVTSQVHHFETYFSTPFHLDSIVAGSFLALLVEVKGAARHLARWSGWASAILAICFVGVTHACPWFIRVTNAPIYNSLGYAAISWTYFFFLAWVVLGREDGVVSRALSWNPLLYLARISYGLALVDPFVIAILKRILHLPFGLAGETANMKIFPIAIVISLAVCALLYHFVERPSRAWGIMRAKGLQAQEGDPVVGEEEMVSRAQSDCLTK